VGVLYVASQLPGFNANQTQDVGVTSVFGLERAAAFVVLVFIVPFCEELMFRGLLYGKLRQEKLPWWLAALVVSALFGLAHGQWNVGLDVFCLSIVACGLRELTGTIWAGVLVHIIKNFIAFALLFLVTS
jgi:membrane protease YdiL (CAAX protease family)